MRFNRRLGLYVPSGVPAPSDPYWANVVLLLDASSYADGSTPSTLDVTGKTPAYRNDAKVKTDQFKFGSASLYFDGTNDRVSFADSNDWAMGTGDATYEMWVRFEGSYSAGQRMLLGQAASTGDFYSVLIRRHADDYWGGAVTNGTTTYADSTHIAPVASDTWVHLAVVRHGANLYGFTNGVKSVLTTALSGVTLMNNTGPLSLGSYADENAGYHFKGWVDQLRITKGVARYTADFTPPTAAFPHS